MAPMGNSEMIRPLAAISAASFLFSEGYTTSTPHPRTAIVAPSRGEAGLVGSGIDAARHAGRDGEPGASQIARKAFGGGNSVGSGMAGSHDADAERAAEARRALGRKGRAADRRCGAAARDSAGRPAGISCPPASFMSCCWVGRVFETAAAGNGAGERAAQSGGFQFAGGRAENRLRSSETFEKSAGAAGAESGHQAEREPVEFFFGCQGAGKGGGQGHPKASWRRREVVSNKLKANFEKANCHEKGCRLVRRA